LLLEKELNIWRVKKGIFPFLEQVFKINAVYTQILR